MSRTAYFAIGIGILLLCGPWFLVGGLMFFANAVGHDSRSATLYDSSFLVIYAVFGGGLLAGIWAAFWCFRQTFRPPPKVLPPAAPTPSAPTKLATPDEKLAHLVKKP